MQASHLVLAANACACISRLWGLGSAFGIATVSYTSSMPQNEGPEVPVCPYREYVGFEALSFFWKVEYVAMPRVIPELLKAESDLLSPTVDLPVSAFLDLKVDYQDPILVLKPYIRAIPETMVCSIMFVSSFGPLQA